MTSLYSDMHFWVKIKKSQSQSYHRKCTWPKYSKRGFITLISTCVVKKMFCLAHNLDWMVISLSENIANSQKYFHFVKRHPDRKWISLKLHVLKYVKRVAHGKMKILSLITHPRLIPNLTFVHFWNTNLCIVVISESFLTLHRQQHNYHIHGPER